MFDDVIMQDAILESIIKHFVSNNITPPPPPPPDFLYFLFEFLDIFC